MPRCSLSGAPASWRWIRCGPRRRFHASSWTSAWTPAVRFGEWTASSVRWPSASRLVGLTRLGRHKLRLDDTPGDRTLGLRPVGHLAFSGFWIFSVGFAPILILTATSTPTLVLNLVFFLIGFALFVLSLNRLPQQLVEAKRTHSDLSRQL